MTQILSNDISDAQPPRWVRDPLASDLAGFDRLSWRELATTWIDRAKDAGTERVTLEPAARDWLLKLGSFSRLAVTDVTFDGPSIAADLLGYVVAPASRLGIELIIGADREFPAEGDPAFLEAEYGYGYALERLRWQLFHAPSPSEGRRGQVFLHTGFEIGMTQSQAAAIGAWGGVVQVIGSAGSGKTSVLVEHVKELLRRGATPQSIVCLTFNAATRDDLRARLHRAGAGNVTGQTFHGLTWQILLEAGGIAPKQAIRAPTLNEWRMICATAQRETGLWIDPQDAKARLSEIKLAQLLTADEYAASVMNSADEVALTTAAIYQAYEQVQRTHHRFDFDDLIVRSAWLLRADPELRARWQHRYQHVLVDEYQEILPAQELIVRMIAAPQDQLFCVGDDDQTLYAFKHVNVKRIICLDQHYPGLQRIVLDVDHRNPPDIVRSSRALIDHNRIRFPMAIAPGRGGQGLATLREAVSPLSAAADIAALLAVRGRGEVVVLARTIDSLRPIALACAERGVAIDGPVSLFTPANAHAALRNYLRLALDPAHATASLVSSLCTEPARPLGRDVADTIAKRLQKGQSFEAAFAAVPTLARDVGQLPAPGDVLTKLAACHDAADGVALLRGPGGFDDWFSDGLGSLEQSESEYLERAESDAAGRSLSEFLADLDRQAAVLHIARDEQHGIELLTIHRAKGRQWPHVILVACDDGTLPHARALAVGPGDLARGGGIEAERRLCYVAFTRATEHLEIHYDPRRPSPFLHEAGLGDVARIPVPNRPEAHSGTFDWLPEPVITQAGPNRPEAQAEANVREAQAGSNRRAGKPAGIRARLPRQPPN
jgi:DNA helicase-2/ATP-dependent DNA helicase PcrA